jgi:hypothetical protein
MSMTSAEKTRRWRAANPERAAEKNRRDARIWNMRHPEEAKARSGIYRQKYPDRHIKAAYGLTGVEYDALLASQAGLCASCGRPETVIRDGIRLRLAVDHVHETGQIRGLLCGRCNRGIGNFDDDPDRLEAAARYLRARGPQA